MRLALGWVVVAAACALPACETAVECGPGTARDGDVCVLATEPPPAPCGPHTVFDEDAQQCVPELPPTTCGEFLACLPLADGTYTCSCGAHGEPECQ